MTDVRVRFAPSPTGMFHVGSARAALFNWAVAERAQGRFILRIEDTDASRNRPEWTEGIIAALDWIGINGTNPVFEGPYFQSANEPQHREAVAKLLADGKAYHCDCTREQVQERTGSKDKGYDGHCRERGLTAGAVRFRTPDEGVTVVDDLVRGRVEFPNKAQEDFVIARSDGSPLYVLANAVDDITQAITHVARGEEHLPNAARQELLWPALGATTPVWAHLPVIVNEQRKKLSKRRDKVALEDYRREGYLAEAMVNYLMLLGWGPGDDREIMPWTEMAQLFRLEDVNPSNAFFDEKKLRAFNGEYIRALPLEVFEERCEPFLDPSWDRELFSKVAALAQTRIAVLSEIRQNVDFLFLEEPVFDQASWDKAMKNSPLEILTGYLDRIESVNWDPESLKQALEEVGTAQGLKLGKAQAPVRVAVTGRTVGLPLFESIEVLGRERTQERLRAALARLRG
ncbi:glutamate--tRNA ligase [Nonomuraea longispora]|uniref:Glutamate--tRNA ligase n=2 Tax=Nonomuraea longispora TaxID=1848320 RepID=A0A4R4N986_9ACTN|nr:glutamate--tRNA ligase [Nonomuraea longispora]TDC04674.1 glutamate--tRNA ligase [Nonomuraea longispora]